MYINKPKTDSPELVAFNEMQYLVVLNSGRQRECMQQCEDLGSVLEVAARQFADDKRVACYLKIEEHLLKMGVAVPQVINPYRPGPSGRSGRPAAWNRLEIFLRAPELCESLAALNGNDGFETALHQRGLFFDPCQPDRFF